MSVAREYLRLTKEATYGTFDGSALAANIAVINLHQANAWTMRPRPLFAPTRSAGGSNRPVILQSAQTELSGKLTTLLHPSQAKLLMAWGITLAGAPLNTFSVTADYAFVPDDGSATIYRRSLGCKVDALAVAGQNSGEGVRVACSLDVTAQQPATITAADFPEPTYASTPAYPTDNPYLFQQSKAGLAIGGSTRASYRDFSLSVKNILRKPFDENPFISSLAWSGRDVSFDVTFRLLSNANRAAYEAVTQEALSLALTDGTNTLTFNAQGNCRFSAVADDLNWGSPGFYQKCSLMAMLDTTVGTPTDLTVAQTP